jgi:hypothetical protein
MGCISVFFCLVLVATYMISHSDIVQLAWPLVRSQTKKIVNFILFDVDVG